MEYTLKEYNKRLAEIEEEVKNKKIELAKEFAKANNPHKRGDIIKDDIGSLIIEKISLYFGFANSLPHCSYSGIELKKDGTPMKRQSKRHISQFNIIE